MIISTRLLQAFIALEETRHFTQAAERCNLTQSAFSQLIRRLEAAVGTRLFDRDTRSVRLTAEGKLFSARAGRILQEINSALSEMRDYADGKKGKLALAIIPSLVASWQPQILQEYVRLYPGVSIQVFDTHPERGLQMLNEGLVDIVIATEPGHAGEYEVRRLFREPYFLTCQAQHPLAKKKVVQLRHLAGLSMIYPLHIDNTRVVSGNKVHKLRQLMESAGVTDSGIAVEHRASITALVGAGMGVSVVPHMSYSEFASTAVALIPIARNAMMREVYLVQRGKQSLSVAAARFVEVMDRHTPNLSP